MIAYEFRIKFSRQLAGACWFWERKMSEITPMILALLVLCGIYYSKEEIGIRTSVKKGNRNFKF